MEPFVAGSAEPFLEACLATLGPEDQDRVTIIVGSLKVYMPLIIKGQ